MTHIPSQADELKRRTDAQIKTIQSDKDLTHTAKAKRIAEIRAVTNKKLADYQNQHLQAKTEQRDSLHRRLFGLGYTATATEADKSAAKLNYRDALFRADSIKDESAALRMLGRANMVNDKELAKAIAAVSYENGWERALNDYATAQGAQDKLNELINHESGLNSPSVRMRESMSFSQIQETPEEILARMSGENVSA